VHRAVQARRAALLEVGAAAAADQQRVAGEGHADGRRARSSGSRRCGPAWRAPAGGGCRSRPVAMAQPRSAPSRRRPRPAAMRLPVRCCSSQAPVTWSACTCVSSVATSVSPSSRSSARSRRTCSKTGSISTASPCRGRPAGRCRWTRRGRTAGGRACSVVQHSILGRLMQAGHGRTRGVRARCGAGPGRACAPVAPDLCRPHRRADRRTPSRGTARLPVGPADRRRDRQCPPAGCAAGRHAAR
jgi:hypothetical protein